MRSETTVSMNLVICRKPSCHAQSCQFASTSLCCKLNFHMELRRIRLREPIVQEVRVLLRWTTVGYYLCRVLFTSWWSASGQEKLMLLYTCLEDFLTPEEREPYQAVGIFEQLLARIPIPGFP